MLNPNHAARHTIQFIDALAMPDLTIYILIDKRGRRRKQDGMYLLSSKGEKILHQCCLLYIGYILDKLENYELKSRNRRLVNSKELDFWSSIILPDNEKAIKLNDEEVVIVQEYPIAFAIESNNFSTPDIHKWNCRVVFGIQEITTDKNEKKLFLTLKSVYPPGNNVDRPYLYPPWDNKRPSNEDKIQERFSILRKMFKGCFITPRLQEWYKTIYPEMTESEIKSKIYKEKK